MKQREIYTEIILDKGLSFIQQYRGWLLGLLGCLLALSAYVSITNLKVDNGLSLWFLEDNPSYQNYINYQERSGSDEIIIAMIPSENPLDPILVSQLETLSEFLEEKPYVQSSLSIANARYPKLIGSQIRFQKLYEADRPLESQKKLLAQLPSLQNQLLGRSQKQAFLYIQLSPITTIETQRKQVVLEISQAIEASFKSAQLSGPPILNEAYNQGIFKESMSFGLLSALVISLMLWFLLPEKKFLWIVLGAIAIPLGLLFGIISSLGFSLNMISMLIPTILLVYTVCDAVHIVHIYHRLWMLEPQTNKITLLKKSFQKSFIPCALTTLTTILSYLALYSAPLPAFKSMGIITVLGLVLSFFMVYIVIALGVFILDIPLRTNKKNYLPRFQLSLWMTWIDHTTTRYKNSLITVGILVFICGLLAVPFIQVDTNSKDLISEGKVKASLAQIEEQIGGSSRLQLNISELPQSKVSIEKRLQKIASFQDSIEKLPQIGAVFSLVNLERFLKKRNPLWQLGSTKSMESELSFENKPSEASFFPMGSEDGNTLYMSLSFKQMNTAALETLISDISAMFERQFKEEARLEIQGFATVYTQLNNFILKSQLYSFIWALIGSLVCLLLFVKKIRTSLIILLPNLLPLAVLALCMVALDIPLGVTTAMITPIMLGIVMDDSIHLLYHYRPSKNKIESSHDRISYSLQYNGKALFTATISLMAGFLVIASSHVPSVTDFGILCAVTVGSALISDLFFLTALLKRFDQ